MLQYILPTAILWWNIKAKVTGHQKLEADVTLKMLRIFTSCAPQGSRLINAHCRTVCLIEIHNLYYLELWKNGERSHLTQSYQYMMPFSKCDVFLRRALRGRVSACCTVCFAELLCFKLSRNYKFLHKTLADL